MVELILKTNEQDTIRDQRLKALQKGEKIVTQYGGLDGTVNYPVAESVGVSYQPELSGGGEFEDASLINNLQAPQLSGGLTVTRPNVSFLDTQMRGLGGKTIRQAFADGTLDQIREDARMRVQLDRAGNVRMDGNSLLENWQTLVDASRIQLAVNKALNTTVRDFFYNIYDRPQATAIENVNELYEDAILFEENDGTGQQVEMGEMRGGQTDTVTQRIYAAGLTYDLKKYLFDPTFDMAKANRAIVRGEVAKKDDTALAPIINYSYSGTQQTAANTSGSTREENLWLTISDALEDIVNRRDPVTSERLIPMGCVMLAHPVDAMHLAEVLPGFDNVSQNVKRRQALTQISRVVGYEGARIQTRSKGLVTFTDLTEKTAYIVVPNRRMLISRKRPLQMNIDTNPDVLRLARERMSWWYCEGLYNDGIGYYIQEVTLPTW